MDSVYFFCRIMPTDIVKIISNYVEVSTDYLCGSDVYLTVIETKVDLNSCDGIPSSTCL